MAIDTNSFKFRVISFVALLAVWALVTVGMLFYYSVAARDNYLALGNKIAVRRGIYYPPRGRILDKNGVVLAWSEKLYDLYWLSPPHEDKVRNKILTEVHRTVPTARLKKVKNRLYLLKRNITTRQIVALEKLIQKQPDIKIIPRIQRKIIDVPQVKLYVGKIRNIKGECHGRSGIEKRYDQRLSGRAGEYEIMVDRNKNWVPNSWRLVRKAVPGQDVKLDLSLADLRKDDVHE